MLDKSKLLTPAKVEPIRVELMGDCVYVRPITLKQLLPSLKVTDEVARNAQVIASCVCDDQGKPLLTVQEAKQFVENQPANVS